MKFNVVILLHTDTKPDRDRLRGILRFAKTHPEWNLLTLPGHPAIHSLLQSEEWKADGIITNDYVLANDFRAAAQWLSTSNVVLTDAYRPSPVFRTKRQICVNNDDAAIGRLAVEFFVKRKYTNLAYVQTIQPRQWSDSRAKAFAASARSCGCLHCEYSVPARKSRGWGVEEKRLATWLRRLPKPCGILAANDARALHVIRAAAFANISIPDQIAVLGVDNNDLDCEFSRPTLSSIEPEFEQCGFLAAKSLHRMMCGKPPRQRTFHYGNPRIIERNSTFDQHGTARIITAAKAFIQANATRGITIGDVASAVRVSPRTLERRFLTLKMGPPSSELLKTKLQCACRLLSGSSLPLGEIASHCGFNSNVRLKIAFKKAYRMTMSEYRARAISKP